MVNRIFKNTAPKKLTIVFLISIVLSVAATHAVKYAMVYVSFKDQETRELNAETPLSNCSNKTKKALSSCLQSNKEKTKALISNQYMELKVSQAVTAASALPTISAMKTVSENLLDFYVLYPPESDLGDAQATHEHIIDLIKLNPINVKWVMYSIFSGLILTLMYSLFLFASTSAKQRKESYSF